MIDSDWLATVRCFSGANLGNEDIQRLSKVLGEQEEVLPYLLLKTDAFAGWPAARGAIKAAIKAAIRPTAWQGSAEKDTAPHALRETFRAQIAGVLQASEGADRIEAVSVVTRLRSYSAAQADEPHTFIDF